MGRLALREAQEAESERSMRRHIPGMGRAMRAGGSGAAVIFAAEILVCALATGYLAVHGWPKLGEGRVYPYWRYLVLNAATYPVAQLVVPLVFTKLVSRRPITRQSLALLRDGGVNMLLTLPAVALGFKAFLEGWVGHVTYRVDRPLWVLFGEGLLFLLLADFWFYVSHRASHTRLLYRFHVSHHTHKTPTEASAFFALSLVEVSVSGLGMVFFPLFFLHIHVVAWLVGTGVILLFGLFIHDSTLVSSALLPILNGPTEHQLHHRRGRKNANYSVMFTHLDKLFGTYAAPGENGVQRGTREERLAQNPGPERNVFGVTPDPAVQGSR
jgi:sterol desaturase/sphingolipid hydroxylase (fatty acid hydroxylase superfamily)